MKGATERPKRIKNPPDHELFLNIQVVGSGWTRTFRGPQKVPAKVLHREWWKELPNGSMHNRIGLRKNKRDYPELETIQLP